MDARPIGQFLVIIGQNVVNVGQFSFVFCPMMVYHVSVAGQIMREK
jgi:hypothetical protein